jgi:serine/threonine protein kinase
MELGSGSYGVVYKGVWRNQHVAVKKVKGELSDAQLQNFKQEAELLSNLRPHRNVVLFLGVCLEPLCIGKFTLPNS